MVELNLCKLRFARAACVSIKEVAVMSTLAIIDRLVSISRTFLSQCKRLIHLYPLFFVSKFGDMEVWINFNLSLSARLVPLVEHMCGCLGYGKKHKLTYI